MSANERKAQDSQPQGNPQQQQGGEGSYSGTKQYNDGLKKHMNQHDVEKEALDAAPKSEQEAREMEEAERIARGKSKGEDSGMPKSR